ncbi:MAG: TolC family protein [bacterium]
MTERTNYFIFQGVFLALCVSIVLCIGCQSLAKHRMKADQAALTIIKNTQRKILDKHGDFSIERPSDILRRRLLRDQQLPYTSEASLGIDQLTPIDHWPEKIIPPSPLSSSEDTPLREGKPLLISLIEALQIGARNNFTYQTKKEDIFSAALDLYRERDEFRHTFTGQVETLLSTDGSSGEKVNGTEYSGTVSVGKKLKSGAHLATSLAVDVANLLTLGGASSLGIMADATMTIPLLRGAGKHVSAESMVQAERTLMYAMYEFERFKRILAVDIASEYLTVLQHHDQVINTEKNYQSLAASARRSRQLANSGRLPEIQVDQALQNELRAHNRWITAQEEYKRRLDSFKTLLGLPPDADIELDRSELERLSTNMQNMRVTIEENTLKESRLSEIDDGQALRLALENRLDLLIVQGKVYDAQRSVVIAADGLGAELTLLGKAEIGERRTIASATSEDARFDSHRGKYSALLTLDMPWERTQEAVAYRNSLLNLEQAVREVQKLEDEIKLSVRNKLRDLLEFRESLSIEAMSIALAEKRVKSITLFLEAGRAEIRDLLEAQDALLTAQNGLTSAAVNYRIAELELQRDMGVLMVDDLGLWKEYTPGEKKYEHE